MVQKINNVLVKREEFLKKLNEVDNALIFHYDILAEGIDVDGITGVIISRNMTISKLLQTIGRAMRIYKSNPKLKPYAWVSVTSKNDDNEMRDFVIDLIDELQDEGFDMSENVTFTGNKDSHLADNEDEVDDAYDLAKRQNISELEQDIRHSVYNKKFTKSINELKDMPINEFSKAIDNLINEGFAI